MKKIIMSLLLFVAFIGVSLAVDPRISIFSTTVDWSAVTGLGLRQYTVDVVGNNKDLIKQGLVLFYLDGFPCYGESDSVRLWISSKGKVSGNLRLVCVHKPDSINFAWRNADEKATDTKTEGMISCPIDGEYSLKLDISKCVRGKKWVEYK